jgi:hypothetical protein
LVIGIKSHGDKKEVEIEPPTDKKVTQIFQNTIYASNVSLGNIGKTTQYNIAIQPGDFAGLKKYLKELGITEELINELGQAFEKGEKSVEQPGPATSSWLARVMIMIGRGSLSLANNTAGSLVAAAIMQYLGVK